MPVNASKMKALKKEYGKDKGKSVYYALENKEKPKRGERTRKNKAKKS